MRADSVKKVVPARKRESCLRVRAVVSEVEVELEVEGLGSGVGRGEGEGEVMFGMDVCWKAAM